MSRSGDELASISQSTGFAPEEEPLDELLAYYAPWERILGQIQSLISQRRLRREIDSLPLLIVSQRLLPTERHWRRADLVLTYLSQGYLWMEGEGKTVEQLPRVLSIPWWEVSSHLGLPPVITYATSVLWNWHMKDPSRGLSMDNLSCQALFTGARDEEWFYLVSLQVEFAAAPGIAAAQCCLQAVAENDVDRILQCLETVCRSLRDMTTQLQKMYNECSPSFFFNQLRPFFAGSKNLSSFPNGLVFEGVQPDPIKYNGASAAQSSTLQVFDVLLGVEHSGTTREFLQQQRWYMPREHRQYLLMLENQPTLKDFIAGHAKHSSLKEAFDTCALQLGELRSKHIVLVTRYIVVQAIGTGRNKEKGTLAKRGTGGTDFMLLLKSSRDDTKETTK